MSSEFWGMLGKVSPIGIFIILFTIVILTLGPNFVKRLKEVKSAAVLVPIKAGEETTESWVMRIENSMRKVLEESFRDRDLHIKQVFTEALDEFLSRLKENVNMTNKKSSK